MTDAKELNRIRVQALADGVGEVAVTTERKGDVVRLQMPVLVDSRERLDRQPRKCNEALFGRILRKSISTASPCRRACGYWTGWSNNRKLSAGSRMCGRLPIRRARSAFVPDEVRAHVRAQSSNGQRMEVWTIKKIARLIMQEPCSTTGKVVLQDRILLDEPVGQRVRFHKTIPPPPAA